MTSSVTGPARRLLLLEADGRLRAAAATRLRAEGHVVVEVGTLAEAQRALGRDAFDCLVIGRALPDGDSVRLVAEVDEDPDRPPMLVISASDGGAGRVDALVAGADDQMVRPVHLDELVLRIQKLLARPALPREDVVLGRVVVDRQHRHITRNGERVHLTPTQYKVFEELALNAGSLVSKSQLHDRCWDPAAQIRSTTVHSHITRLRRLFDRCLVFECEWGVGYTLRVDGETDDTSGSSAAVPSPRSDRTVR